MGKTRNVANISSLVTTDLTNNFVGIGSTIPKSKLNVVGITTVGVGKSFRSEMDLTGTVTKAHHINTTDNVNLTYNINADSFSSSTTGSILGCGYTTAAIVCQYMQYNQNAGSPSTPADSWLGPRILNIVEQDIDNIVSLSSNKFTLGRGFYVIRWRCPTLRLNFFTSRLQQTIDGTTITIALSDAGYSREQDYYDQGFCEGHTLIKQTAATAEYYIESKNSYGSSVAERTGAASNVSPFLNYYNYVIILKGDL